MPTHRPQPITGNFYHVYNRGVEKRDITADDVDRSRFVYDLYEFNDADAVWNIGRYYAKSDWGPTPIIVERKREELVDILAFALMPNHYHLLLRQKRDGGISEFMKKLGAGYTSYFNLRHERVGSLFQGKYKAKIVPEDALLEYVLAYIHLNPVGLSAKRTKKHMRMNVSEASKILREYRWSSYLDFIGEETYPQIINLALARQRGLPIGLEHKEMIDKWVVEYVSRHGLLTKIAIDES